MAKSIPTLIRAVMKDGADAYRAAIAAQIEGKNTDDAWAAWEQDTAALLLVSWAAGAATSLDSAGVPVPKSSVVQFDRPEDGMLLQFEPGPAREVVARFMETVPLTRARWNDLIAKAIDSARELREDEEQTAVQKMADRSPALRALLFPGTGLPQEVQIRREPGVQEVARTSFVVTGLSKTKTDRLRGLLAKVVRGQTTVTAAGKTLKDIGIPEFIEEARDVLKIGEDLTDARLENVYRTNLSRAQTQGRLDVCRDRTVKRFIPLMRYSATKDSRTRPTHKAMDGYIATTEMIDGLGISTPGGFQCFPADQPITGIYDIGMRASYCGPLVRLAMRSGRRVAVTPNHPILTTRGWIPANEVQVGDQCMNCLGNAMPLAKRTRNVQANYRPALAVEVFDAIAAQGIANATIGANGSVLMFHGDSKVMQGEIDVIWADRELAFTIDGRRFETIEQHSFVGTGQSLSTLSALHKGLQRTFRPTDGIPRSSALPFDGSGIILDPLPLEQFGLAPAAWTDTPRKKAIVDARSRTAEGIGDLLDAFAGSVTLDDVVDVEIEPEFAGHVYDFRSSSGIVIADGIITSNCRCVWVPVPIATAVAKGWTDPDGVPDINAIRAHNGSRQQLIDSGQFPDPGFISG